MDEPNRRPCLVELCRYKRPLRSRTIGPGYYTGELLDRFHRYPVGLEQNGSDCRQAIHYVFDNRFRTTSVT